MADATDEQDINLNEDERQDDAIVEDTNEESDEQSEDTQDDVEEDDQQDDSEEEDAEEEPPKPPSRREQLRIQQLLERMNQREKDSPKPTLPDGFIDYGKDLDADDETVTRLKTDREEFGTRMYNQGLEQMKATEFRMQLNIDAPRVESKYPQLDKTSDKFNPVAARAINMMYLSATGYDPQKQTVQNADVRYADYVESIFELASEIAENKVEEAKKVVRSQAGKTGIRPNGNATKKLNLNKAPQDMSDDELKAFLGQYYPTK